MINKNDNEFIRLLSLSALLNRIAARWKKIIVVVFVAFVVSMVFNYPDNDFDPDLPNQNTIDNYNNFEKIKQYEDTLSNSYSNSVQNINKNLLLKNDYFANSEVANLNPYAVPVAQKTYLISAPYTNVPINASEGYVIARNTDIDVRVKSILTMLATYRTTGIDWDQIADLFGSKKGSYLSDVVYLLTDNNTFTIQVSFRNKTESKKVLDYLSGLIEEKFNNYVVDNNMSDYTLSEMTSGVSEMVRSDWFNWQVSVNNQIRDLEAARTIASSRLEKNEQIVISSSMENTTSKPNFVRLFKSGIKYSILFSILYIGCLATYLVLSNKVLSANEFNRNFNIKKLTSYSVNKAHSNTNLSFTNDDFLYSNRKVGIEWAAKEINDFYPNDKTIGIVSDKDFDEIDLVVDELSKTTEKEYVKLINIPNNIEALDLLKKCDLVIAICLNEKTDYNRMFDCLNIVNRYNIDVIGSINVAC